MRLVILAFCASLALYPASRKTITLDEFLSQPTAHSLTPIWSPDGKSFTYRQKDDVYLYDVAKRQAKHWFTAKATSTKNPILAKSPRQFAIVPMVSEWQGTSSGGGWRFVYRACRWRARTNHEE